MRHNNRKGSVAVEAAMWMPILFLLIVGTVQFGKITYLYYTLQKIVNSTAQYLGTQNGVNFCPGAGDATIAAAIQFGLTGTTDGNGTPVIANLTPDMIQVSTLCVDATGATVDCDVSGCDTPAGAQRPVYIVVSIPAGYQVRPRIPYILLDPVALKPRAVVPFGGAS